MRIRIISILVRVKVFMLAVAFGPMSSGATAETVGWEDLIPSEMAALEQRAAALEEAFGALDESSRERYLALAHKRRPDAGRPVEMPPGGEMGESSASTDAAAFAFWEEVDAVNAEIASKGSATVGALDGRAIRLPGYVLPLEHLQGKVQEFLLVPYVGACIHTPPPPANQMVHVTFPEGFESRGLYAPVWVEGTMTVRQGKYRVSFADGADSVSAGYSLRANVVKDYQPQ